MAFEIRVPRLGWSMEEGTFAGWLKSQGDLVRAGEPLFSLEGEKATQDIESLDSGFLQIHPNAPIAGKVVLVGALLGVLVPEGEVYEWECADSPTQPTSIDPFVVPNTHPPAPASPSARRLARQKGLLQPKIPNHATPIAADAPPMDHTLVTGASAVSTSTLATPRARKLGKKLALDWRTIPGSGRNGRVRERDILVWTQSSPPQNPDWISLPLTNTRKRIAERLAQSRNQAVPVTLTTKANATKLVALRQRFKNAQGAVPSFTDILAKCVALCLVDHPLLAGRWKEDHLEYPKKEGIHIGIAVDTEHGLFVPVLRNLAHASLFDIAKKSTELAHLARIGRLPAEAMKGGVFTLSSLGSLGVEFFTPVINPPETAILGVGTMQNEAIFQEDGSLIGQKRLPLSLTFDHRIVDGAPAARFLRDLVLLIETPPEALGCFEG